MSFSNARFGPGSGPIHLDDVNCLGTETRIIDCSYTSVSNCFHFEDASVSCTENCKSVQNVIIMTNYCKNCL